MSQPEPTAVLNGLTEDDVWEFGTYCGARGIGTTHSASLAGGFTCTTTVRDQEAFNALWAGYCRQKLVGRPPDPLRAATEAVLEGADLR